MSIVHNAYPTEVLLAYFRAILGQLCYYLEVGWRFYHPTAADLPAFYHK